MLQRLVEALFAPMGGPPLFIDGVIGASFLARGSEDLPLVRRYYLPNAVLVSPTYKLASGRAGESSSASTMPTTARRRAAGT